MAKGIGENPVKSPAFVAQLVEYPVTREELAEAAGEAEAPAEVINFFKSLPEERYETYEAVLRDFAEAERRFGVGFTREQGPGRSNLGRTIVEDTPGVPTRHP